MKTIFKTSYIISGSMLLLSSCAQEETPDVPADGGDRRIVFHTSLPEVTTRATEIVTDLSNFFMTAFDETDDKFTAESEYFNNKEITNTSGRFVSDECVWPDPGKESNVLRFFAYYPSAKSMQETVGGDTFKLVNHSVKTDGSPVIDYRLENFQVAPDIANQVDFVTAYATGSMADNLFSGISLTFKHQLSRIEIKAKGSHKSCDIEIAGVCMANVPMQGNFEFQKSSDADGKWTSISRGNAEYIFHKGDAIVKVGSDPVSILGGKIKGDNDNCAMLIPSVCSAWDVATDITNAGKGLYLNVLLRIIDKTPTTGKGTQQYPYFDKSQGLNAMNIPRVVLAVDEKGIITDNFGQLYKGDDGKYYTDATKKTEYTVPSGSTVKEFGWAALPISADWQPGYSYTYTLDYTSGVGLHGPEITGTDSPKAGDPIISDRVGVTVIVNDWQGLNGSTTHKIEVPGS